MSHASNMHHITHHVIVSYVTVVMYWLCCLVPEALQSTKQLPALWLFCVIAADYCYRHNTACSLDRCSTALPWLHAVLHNVMSSFQEYRLVLWSCWLPYFCSTETFYCSYHSTYRATTIMLPYDDEYYHVTAYYCRTYHTMTMVLPYDEKCYHIL